MKLGKLSKREMGLVGILAVLVVILIYNYAFLTPTKSKIAAYEQEILAIDDQIIVAEAKVLKMGKMEDELAKIKSGEVKALKELPAYDNSRNVMNSLSTILDNASQYNVSFAGVSEADGIVRREISLNYACGSYDAAKSILTQIYEGPYRCLLKDVHISQSSGVWSVVAQITYFEYK